MPDGNGWFIDVKSGRAIPIYEHATAVRADPDRYRVSPGEIEGKGREPLLKFVFERGFIRVRWDKSGIAFEFHGNRERALQLIRRFARAKKVDNYTRVRINDLSDADFRMRGCWLELVKTLPPLASGRRKAERDDRTRHAPDELHAVESLASCGPAARGIGFTLPSNCPPRPNDAREPDIRQTHSEGAYDGHARVSRL